MNKKHLTLVLFVLLLVSLIILPAVQANQDKEKTKDKVSGVGGGVIGGVVGGVQGRPQNKVQGGVQGGVIGGIMRNDLDDDFLLEPRKIVQFKIEHLLLKPAETILLPETTDLRTDFGQTVSYSYSSPAGTKRFVGLEITPILVEDKGIDLNIVILQDDQIIKKETIHAGNFEPVVVELLEDKEAKVKLADRITPLIQVINPIPKYPTSLEKFGFVNDVLIMNETMLINHSRGGSLSAGGGSETEPSYLFFWVKGKGVYVLSFWPFEGAEPVGVVSSNAIRIRHNKDHFAWLSMKPILRDGKWRVWVRNNPSFDPNRDAPWGPSKDTMEYKESAMAGVFSGRKALEKFFGK